MCFGARLQRRRCRRLDDATDYFLSAASFGARYLPLQGFFRCSLQMISLRRCLSPGYHADRLADTAHSVNLSVDFGVELPVDIGLFAPLFFLPTALVTARRFCMFSQIEKMRRRRLQGFRTAESLSTTVFQFDKDFVEPHLDRRKVSFKIYERISH